MERTPPAGTVRVQFIGNATLLIRYGALTLLTDPNFLHRGQLAHLGYGLVSRRLTEPAVDVADLPTATWTRWCCRICTATTSTGWRGAIWTVACRS